jgi:hypothetical protein
MFKKKSIHHIIKHIVDKSNQGELMNQLKNNEEPIGKYLHMKNIGIIPSYVLPSKTKLIIFHP